MNHSFVTNFAIDHLVRVIIVPYYLRRSVCGPGTQSTVVMSPPQYGGAPCTIATQSCNLKPCPVDCEVSQWGNCNRPCGGGVRTRTVIKPSSGGGTQCPTDLTEACNMEACPVDCVMSPWSECNRPCGGGERTRTVVTPAVGSGAKCPTDLTQTCNTQACPIDCLTTGWSACSKPCNGGRRSTSIIRGAANGGQACPTSTLESCNDFECPWVAQACNIFAKSYNRITGQNMYTTRTSQTNDETGTCYFSNGRSGGITKPWSEYDPATTNACAASGWC
jgi:hypothetical protein